MRALDQLRGASADARQATTEIQIAARSITKMANAGTMAFVLIAIVAVVALGMASIAMMAR